MLERFPKRLPWWNQRGRSFLAMPSPTQTLRIKPLGLRCFPWSRTYLVGFSRHTSLDTHRKPEKQAFEHIAYALGVPFGSIMFFDDLVENVEGAKSAGLHAVPCSFAG